MGIPRKSILSFAEELKQILDTRKGQAIINSTISQTGDNEVAKSLAAIGDYQQTARSSESPFINKVSSASNVKPGVDLRVSGPAGTRRPPQPTASSLQSAFKSLNRARRVSEFTPWIGGT